MTENETTNADPPECPTCGSELCPKCMCPTSGGPGEGCMTEHEVDKAVDATEYRMHLESERDDLKARVEDLERQLGLHPNIETDSADQCFDRKLSGDPTHLTDEEKAEGIDGK